ncbi:D-arabinono-1,4-lactone oxidase [Luteimicrobium sp. DT211]|uniref:D-arabinono-1,4-lactone oxidase n=1 Tax=Luteimicrobium sp. DT211 TaxID=3393412 RepID=UPI003CEFDDC4
MTNDTTADATTSVPWRPAPAWRNWGHSQTARPRGVARPASEDELRAVLGSARDAGLGVKPVGAGHSFTGIAVAPGVQLDLGGLSGLRAVDTAAAQVTLGAGTHLFEIPGLLAPYGLAMPNLGDIDRQTLAGAVSTGTHGTGAGFGGIATQIVRVRLLTADGRLLTVSADENPRYWGAVQVGLGALGVLTEITLQCVPQFALHAVEAPSPLAQVLDEWDERCAVADHFEFYWFPGTEIASTKTNTRLPGDVPLSPVPRLSGWVDDELLANGLYGAICAVGARARGVVPVANRLASRLMARREYTDLSHRVFATSRTVRFREMEFAVPREAVPSVVRELDAMIRARDLRVSFPVEVRAAAADDLWLSTASGRETGYVAIHRYFREDFRPYFTAAQDIFRAHGGRPHWGKLHFLGADDLAELYPRFGDFVRVRDELDPDRLFANPYLTQVLGA